MTDPDFTTTEIAEMLGIIRSTVNRYMNESKPGGRYGQNPFPPADYRSSGRLFWLGRRKVDIIAWDNARVGTGYTFAQPPPTVHLYLSTSCFHDDHVVCQTNAVRYDGTEKNAASCKECSAPCVCDCHQQES